MLQTRAQTTIANTAAAFRRLGGGHRLLCGNSMAQSLPVAASSSSMVLAFPTDKLGKDLLSRAKAAGPVKEEEANELLELVVSNGIASAAAGETSMLADTNAHDLLRRLRAYGQQDIAWKLYHELRRLSRERAAAAPLAR